MIKNHIWERIVIIGLIIHFCIGFNYYILAAIVLLSVKHIVFYHKYGKKLPFNPREPIEHETGLFYHYPNKEELAENPNLPEFRGPPPPPPVPKYKYGARKNGIPFIRPHSEPRKR